MKKILKYVLCIEILYLINIFKYLKKNYYCKMKEKKRIIRYNKKLEKLSQNTENLNEWTEGINEIVFKENLKLIKKYGIYHAFQIAVEIVSDITAMLVKDLKFIPKDDYSNIDILKNKKIINSDLAAKIREANGLRNRIVHDYDDLDNNIAYNKLLELIKSLYDFKEAVSDWLKNDC